MSKYLYRKKGQSLVITEGGENPPYLIELHNALSIDLKELSDIGCNSEELQGSSMIERDLALIHGLFGVDPDSLDYEELLKLKRRAWIYLFASGKASFTKEAVKGVMRDVLKMHG